MADKITLNRYSLSEHFYKGSKTNSLHTYTLWTYTTSDMKQKTKYFIIQERFMVAKLFYTITMGVDTYCIATFIEAVTFTQLIN